MMKKDNPKKAAKQKARVVKKQVKNIGKNRKRGEVNIAKGNEKSAKKYGKAQSKTMRKAKGEVIGVDKKSRIQAMRGEKRANEGGRMTANPSGMGRMTRDRLNPNAPDMNRPGFELTPSGKSVPSKATMDKWAKENAAEKVAKKAAKTAKRKRTVKK